MCLERQHMQILTKFLWLQRPVPLGDQIDGWRVSWVGGWDRCKVFFVVMVVEECWGHGLTHSVKNHYR
jgi:hypothetical protein